MSRIRDIANLFSGSTDAATDAEVTSAINLHATAANGHVGRGTTANRPISPSVGDLYFDTTLNALIAYRTGGWEKVSVDPAPQISSISPTTAAITGTSVTVNGSGFKSGLAVQFIGTNGTAYNSPLVTVIASNIATATTPALSVAYEPYDVKLINSDNQFAILENCLDAGGSPTWNTSSGTIATIFEQSSLNISVSATDPDGTSIIYSSSNLPSWISLNSSTGALTGTSPDISSNTTYSFDVTASDGVNTSSRSFNIAVNAFTAPSAPTIGTVTLSGTTATVPFTAPSNNGGQTITSYTATSSPGGITGTVNQSNSGTITVSGLSYATSYTFTVTATNPTGTSQASSVSNSVTVPSVPSITNVVIYSSYNGGLRSSNYTMQYSDNGSSWTTAFTGISSNNSACGAQQSSGGGGSYGAHRYWRYIEGSAISGHHPRVSRIAGKDAGGNIYNIKVYVSDNCADSGEYQIGTITFDFINNVNV
jgi:Putative Ig domain/Fibronectin type III domain